jgi:hypothetical protein
MNELAITAPPAAASPAEVLQGALIDSRQRWRELVHLASDFAFETDEWGRFTLISPDPALDWAANALIGQPSATLLPDGGGLFDPFRASAKVRHRQAWLKRGDGAIACLTISASPIHSSDGRIIGTRGVGFDTTELDSLAAQTAGALRRAEVMDHVLWRVGQEILPTRMIDAALDVLANVTGAEGVAVIVVPTSVDEAQITHMVGTGGDAVARIAAQSPDQGEPWSPGSTTPAMCTIDARPVLIAPCQTRFGENARLVAWRLPEGRPWDADDSHLIASCGPIIRMILEREAMHREMAQQARTDSLTGLLNRRAFLEEMERHAARQGRDNEPATLMFVDLDNFKPVNDRLGHEAGDDVLRHTAALLRKNFPTHRSRRPPRRR